MGLSVQRGGSTIEAIGSFMAGSCLMKDLTMWATNDKGVGDGDGISTIEAIGSFMAGPCLMKDLTMWATNDKGVGLYGLR